MEPCTPRSVPGPVSKLVKECSKSDPDPDSNSCHLSKFPNNYLGESFAISFERGNRTSEEQTKKARHF